jgi:membrane protein implicated in regulation of membrane protease activity
MTRRRRFFEPIDLPVPKRPYRDTVLFHAALAAILVVVAFLTAGSLGRALVIASGYFVVATAWSWWKFRRRMAEEESTR